MAGVSPAVVSYVLNDGPRGVAPATREAVLKAVAELGYRPNRIAASLRRQRTQSLGLIVPDNTNPYFAELASEIENAAFFRGYTLLMGNAMDDANRESAYVHEFLDRRVDGIILIPSGPAVGAIGEVLSSETPVVVIDREVSGSSAVSQILSDNRGGGEMAARHLIDHGRRRIACIAGPRDMPNVSERVDGWRLALRNGGVAAEGPLAEGSISRFDGRRAALTLLRDDPSVDGIFVTSDEQAIGVLRAIREMDLSCPDDVAVVSFDGTSHAALTTPGLTTVRQPIVDLARSALELLISMTDPAYRPGEIKRLPVTLTPRGSCGCADEFGIEDDAQARPTENKEDA